MLLTRVLVGWCGWLVGLLLSARELGSGSPYERSSLREVGTGSSRNSGAVAFQVAAEGSFGFAACFAFG